MLRKPLNLGTKSVADKMAEMDHQPTPPLQEVEVMSSPPSTVGEQEAMKRYNLVKAKKGSRVDIDEDLHREFKIAAIKQGKTQKDWLEEIIREAVLRTRRKFEK